MKLLNANNLENYLLDGVVGSISRADVLLLLVMSLLLKLIFTRGGRA